MRGNGRPACAAVLVAVGLCGRSARAEHKPALETVPFPPGSAFEAAVAAQMRDAESSLARLSSASGASPARLAEAFGDTGRLFHAYEIWDSAAASYRNAERLAPDDYRWVHLRAVVESRRGDLSLARVLHARALALRPGDVPSLVGLGDACLGLDRLDEAGGAFRSALLRAPGSAASHAGLARVALIRRDYTSARDELVLALRLAPDATRLHYELAMAHRGRGDREEAARELARAGTVGVRVADPLLEEVSRRREGERAHLVRGRLAFVNGRMREAADEFGAAVAAEPNSVTGLVGLGSALGTLGESDRALEALERAIALDPDNVSAHYNLGRIHAARGERDAALREFEAVLRLAPHDEEAVRAKAGLLPRETPPLRR